MSAALSASGSTREPPEGFIAKGQESKVYKLQKSIYGLKQESRSFVIIREVKVSRLSS
jgi:hypothetical protein